LSCLVTHAEKQKLEIDDSGAAQGQHQFSRLPTALKGILTSIEMENQQMNHIKKG
jgi:hypothetical protein